MKHLFHMKEENKLIKFQLNSRNARKQMMEEQENAKKNRDTTQYTFTSLTGSKELQPP